jgi:hypothetical protein
MLSAVGRARSNNPSAAFAIWFLLEWDGEELWREVSLARIWNGPQPWVTESVIEPIVGEV